MKRRWLILLHLVVVFFVSCDEDHDQELRVSPLETSAVTESSAQSGGIILSQGSEEILQQGVCWSTLPDPTTEDSLTVASPGSEFAIVIAELKPKTTYYVRAFARTSSTTVYGNEVSFTTLGYEGWETFDTSNSALPSNNIQKIKVDQNGVAWIGAENFLVRFDGQSFTSYKYSETTDFVKSIYIDSHDNKWIEAWSGLYKFDNINFEKRDTVQGLFVEQDTLWTIRNTQLEKIQISTGTSLSCTLANGQYFELKKDLRGRFLACTRFFRYASTIQIGESNFCSTDNNIVDQVAESTSRLTVSPDSLIYFTTTNAGLGIIKKDLSFEFVNSSNSVLPGDYIFDIAVERDGGRVWLGYGPFWSLPPSADHSSGLVEYSPTQGIIKIHNTRNSGLVDDGVLSVAVMNNNILAGTWKGLSVYSR